MCNIHAPCLTMHTVYSCIVYFSCVVNIMNVCKIHHYVIAHLRTNVGDIIRFKTSLFMDDDPVVQFEVWHLEYDFVTVNAED
jgi:hypothetical protein